MSLFVRILKCECGKMHLCAGISEISICTCGRRLYAQVWTNGHSGRPTA